MADVKYEVNYEDQRFKDVQTDREWAISDVRGEYDDLIGKNDQKENQLLADIDRNQKQQIDVANKNTEFAINKLDQQKDWARKDYLKEQSGAYTDWQKQSNQYGVNAEKNASMGMGGTGYSESSQVAMYNQYQNRVATARESFVRASTEYDNAMAEARLQNSSLLAQIASETLAKKLEISLTFLQQRNSLVTQKAQALREVDSEYYGRWKDVLNQINSENALKEEVRQYNETLAENKRQHNETLAENKRQHDETLAENMRVHNASIAAQTAQLRLERDKFNWQKAQAAAASSSGGSSGSSIKKSSSSKKSSGGSGGRVKSGSSAISAARSGKVGSNVKSSEPTVDMNSVLALGYGPISASKLNDLVASGKVRKYTEGGKIKFKKVVTLGRR